MLNKTNKYFSFFILSTCQPLQISNKNNINNSIWSNWKIGLFSTYLQWKWHHNVQWERLASLVVEDLMHCLTVFSCPHYNRKKDIQYISPDNLGKSGKLQNLPSLLREILGLILAKRAWYILPRKKIIKPSLSQPHSKCAEGLPALSCGSASRSTWSAGEEDFGFCLDVSLAKSAYRTYTGNEAWRWGWGVLAGDKGNVYSSCESFWTGEVELDAAQENDICQLMSNLLGTCYLYQMKKYSEQASFSNGPNTRMRKMFIPTMVERDGERPQTITGCTVFPLPRIIIQEYRGSVKIWNSNKMKGNT